MHLAAFGLLLGLDLVEGELQGAGGCQPGLEQSELDSCGCRADEAEVAVVIFLRYYYRKNNATHSSEQRIRRPKQSALLERHTQRFHELKRELDQLEYFCKGTVLKRMMKCGKAECACASDPTSVTGLTSNSPTKPTGKRSM